MCEVMDRYTKDARIETVIQVLENVHTTKEQIIENLCNMFGLTRSEASERVDAMLTSKR